MQSLEELRRLTSYAKRPPNYPLRIQEAEECRITEREKSPGNEDSFSEDRTEMQSLRELRRLCRYTTKKSPVYRFQSFDPKKVTFTADYTRGNIREPLSRLQRRKPKLPVESLWDIIQFFSFQECGRAALVNHFFSNLLRPRCQLKLELYTQEVEDAQRRLDETNNQIEQRKTAIAQLSGQIGDMTERIAFVGDRLALINGQIAESHDRISALMRRIRELRLERDEE